MGYTLTLHATPYDKEAGVPWKEYDRVSLRLELVSLAARERANISKLCERFGISRKTAYKWLGRFKDKGASGLEDRSRRPAHSPRRTCRRTEELVLSVRKEHPAWGARKIQARLKHLGHRQLPVPSTITAILHRHGQVEEAESLKRGPMQRFQRGSPNELWQMDFKGDFAVGNKRRCYPLTILDDCSRYSLALQACGNQRYETVRQELTAVFERYGLPQAMLTDNGTPWGVPHNLGGGYTRLAVWLLRLNVRVSHGRPYHPQTQGKEERFHRTLQLELLRDGWFRSLPEAQREFDPWRHMYNFERPHEALDMEVPASRYTPSERTMPSRLQPLEYGPGVMARRVSPTGQAHFEGRTLKVSEAFAGDTIGLRATATDGVYELLYGAFHIGEADLRGSRRRRQGEVRLRSLRSLQRTSP